MCAKRELRVREAFFADKVAQYQYLFLRSEMAEQRGASQLKLAKDKDVIRTGQISLYPKKLQAHPYIVNMFFE